MAANALVQTRINETVKDEASAVLATMGLTVSDAVRLMLTRIAHDKALPFEPLTPNAATIEAMRESRKGNLKSFDSIEALMADLDADD
jgi:DNA-damage-inducible protein J